MDCDLQAEVMRLRKMVRLLGVGMVAAASLALVAAAKPDGPADLMARSLTIVDASGTPRVVIAAQVPDPMIGGKRMPRAGAGAGIILNGADGNERGGYMVTDGGEGLLTLDDVDGREMFKVVANSDSGASLFIQHQGGAWAGLSTYRGEPELQMVGRDGKRLHAIPADAPEMP